MKTDLFGLLCVYSIFPTTISYLSLKKVFSSNVNDFIAWQENFLIRLLITISFLPILYLSDINLGLQFENMWINFIFWITLLIAIVIWFTNQYSTVNSSLLFWGVEAGFTEEILFRGVVFGLTDAIFNSTIASIAISSITFGGWHLKNITWLPKRQVMKQIIYTSCIFGPLFSFERIMTGNIYLSVFTHIALNIFVVIRNIHLSDS